MTAPDTTTNAGHERRDIAVRPILIGGAILVVTVLLSAVAMWRLLGRLEAREAERSPAANPLATTYLPDRPPEPRLQAHPLEDLRRLRAREDALLHGYAWIDRGAGTVRIPIERAIDLLVDRSAPPAAPGGG